MIHWVEEKLGFVSGRKHSLFNIQLSVDILRGKSISVVSVALSPSHFPDSQYKQICASGILLLHCHCYFSIHCFINIIFCIIIRCFTEIKTASCFVFVFLVYLNELLSMPLLGTSSLVPYQLLVISFSCIDFQIINIGFNFGSFNSLVA